MNRKKRLPLSIPPRYSKGEFTPFERAANRRRVQWEYREGMKRRGYYQRSFWYPLRDLERVQEFIKDLNNKWEAEQAEKGDDDGG